MPMPSSCVPPTGQSYEQLVGPFYDITGLTKWWGVSHQAISAGVADGTIIACQLVGGQWVYPTWQFTGSRAAHPHLIALWMILRASAVDAWSCAVWLRSPQPELDGLSAADWITGDHPHEAALELARADAQRWAA